MPVGGGTTRRSVVTIGTFDGVHVGHAALVRAAREEADRLATPSDGRPRVVAMVFFPHPMATLDPARIPALLTTFERRRALLLALGADEVIRLEPTPALLGLTPEQFLEGLASAHAPAALVEGADFCFGRARAGDVATLREMGPRFGFRTIVAPHQTAPLRDGSLPAVSSTLVRTLLERGRVRDAAACLGRAHAVDGVVVRGAQRGRTIGFPTANIECACLAPGEGVYAGFATLPDGSRIPAAISVGTNATFGAGPRTVEAHLIDWRGALGEYGWPVALEFVAWLRDQARFDGVEALVAQIGRDVDRARALLARGGAPSDLAHATLQEARA